jgi:hypothetical protein
MLPFLVPLLFAMTVDPFAFILPLMVLWPFYFFFTYDAYRSLRVINGGGWPPGVYAFGVELPMSPYYSKRYFLPWHAIEGVSLHRSGFLARPVINLVVFDSMLPWVLPLSLLGEDNLLSLKTLVEVYQTSSPSSMDWAPELVVYATTGRERMGNS